MVSYGKRFRKKGPEETVFGAGVTSERDDVFMMKEARRFLGSEQASIGKSAVRKAVFEEEIVR